MGVMAPGVYRPNPRLDGVRLSRQMLNQFSVCPSCGGPEAGVRINADGSRRCVLCGMFFELGGDDVFTLRSPKGDGRVEEPVR